MQRSVARAPDVLHVTQAANENALSRILIGFHFRKSVEEGTAYGRKIAVRAVNLNFRPVH